jgi:D-alanine-D-alanine ligase
LKIAVVFGGISTERNVSISGGKAVVEALEGLGHEVIPVDPAFGKDAIEKSKSVISDIHKMLTPEDLKEFSPRNYIDCINLDVFDDIDCAFIVLHGKYGEDGLIQSLLEFREVPYTGSDVKSSSLTIDKDSSKMIFSAAGIPTPEWLTLSSPNQANHDTATEIRDTLGKELVIKPNDQGSTIGISIVKNGNIDDIVAAIELAFNYSEKVVVEQFIEGRELTVGFVGDNMLPVIEIIPEKGFYDYEAKYTKGKSEYVCPAEISEDIAEFMTNLAHTAINVLGCEGFGRVDFRLNEEGVPYCLEANTIPGFTSQSLVPMAAKEIGIGFPELCEELIKLATDKHKLKKGKLND